MPKRTDSDAASPLSPDGEVPPTYNRVLMVNPLSKGSLGKTMFYEYYVSCLDESGLAWEGANMDNRHLAFQQCHTDRVKNLFDESAQAIDEYQPVFAAVQRSQAPIYLLDQRAQADLAFLTSARDTGFLGTCQSSGIKIIPICFAFDDLDYITNLDDTITAFAEEGLTRWLVVSHPDHRSGKRFLKSTLMEHLTANGAVTITMPYLSEVAMARYLASNVPSPDSGGPYSFMDVIKEPHFVRSGSNKELESMILKIARQVRNYEEFLLPDGLHFSSLQDLSKLNWFGGAAPISAGALAQGKARRASLRGTFEDF